MERDVLRSGAFTVSVSDLDPQNPRRVWSAPVPLGWFVREKLREVYGDEWSHEKCQLWLGK